MKLCFKVAAAYTDTGKTNARRHFEFHSVGLLRLRLLRSKADYFRHSTRTIAFGVNPDAQ